MVLSTSATRSVVSLRAESLDFESEGNVVADREVREERVVLEHHVERTFRGSHGGDVIVADQDATRRGLLKPGDKAQCRGLSAAAWSEQREELPGTNLDVDIVDSGDRAETLGDVFDVDGARGGRELFLSGYGDFGHHKDARLRDKDEQVIHVGARVASAHHSIENSTGLARPLLGEAGPNVDAT